MGMPAVAAAPANAARTSFVGNYDAFVSAVKRVGGAEVLASRTDLTTEYINDIITRGLMIDAEDCPQIERATRTPCEELRAELIWHRDGAGEVIGYTCPVDHHDRSVMVAALIEMRQPQFLVEGEWDADSYRAGMLHGVPPEVVNRLMETTYSGVTDWSNGDVLDSLQGDVDQYRTDGAYHCAYGMLFDFDDETREALLAECGVMHSRDWSVQNNEALWAKAQAIRFEHPEKSSVAGPVFALGMAAVADEADQVAYLVNSHAIRPGSTWTAETYDDLTENVRAVVLRSMLAIEKDGTPDWRDILLGQSYGTQSLLFGEQAERMGQAAINLLDCILPGVSAIHDMQWVALDSKDSDGLDVRSVRDLAVFLRSMSELSHLLVNLRDNMQFRLHQLEG